MNCSSLAKGSKLFIICHERKQQKLLHNLKSENMALQQVLRRNKEREKLKAYLHLFLTFLSAMQTNLFMEHESIRLFISSLNALENFNKSLNVFKFRWMRASLFYENFLPHMTNDLNVLHTMSQLCFMRMTQGFAQPIFF